MTIAASPDTVEIAGLPTRLTVGMEVHVELATRSKMWTAAPNIAHPDYFDAEPNTLIDPIVIGMPGTLPVMNREAVAMAIRVGLALGCEIARFTKWDRKSYYYPDLPKNYQISQYDLPLCGPGAIDAPVDDRSDAPRRTVRITRAHLEEDAGTPLLEIVTEPDITNADQAVMFGRTLRNICRFLGVSEGIMQRGQMRFEPNINVVIEQGGVEYATPIVEIKNLNSFKALRAAIQHEHVRQVEQWLEDGAVSAPGAKSTRGWDDAREVTVLQREKEEAHDYRYFPDPDLVPVTVDDAWLEQLRADIPELPLERERRYVRQLGLDVKQARPLAAERDVCFMFEALMEAGVGAKRAAAAMLNNLARRANERGVLPPDLPITVGQVAGIEKLLADNKVSSNSADRLYDLCLEAGPDADPADLAASHNLIQVSDEGALDAWCDQAIADDPDTAEQVRGGNDKAIGRLVGAVMKISRGQANPKSVQQKLREKLAG